MSQLALSASIWLVSSPTRVISSKSQHHSDRQSSGNDRNLKGGREEMESVKNIRGNWKGLRKGERGILLPIPPIHFCRDSHSSFWASKSFFGTSIWVKWGSGWEPRFKRKSFYVEGFPPEAWLIQGRRKTLSTVRRTQALSTFTWLRGLPQSTTFDQSSVSSNLSFTQSYQYFGGIWHLEPVVLCLTGDQIICKLQLGLQNTPCQWLKAWI